CLQHDQETTQSQSGRCQEQKKDRINQSLAELRSLLLNHTSDARLQNPKIEKAEILDLAVEYLQNWTSGRKPNSSDKAGLPPLFTIQSAGFQQCVAQLTSYMHRITPAQRTSLIEGLRHHAEKQQQLKPDFNQSVTDAGRPEAASVDALSAFERKDESPKFPSLSPFQPLSCSTPCHDYLSPPTSPWFSPSFSTYATSPSFPSFASHFSFPPCLSPPSSNASFYSFSPTTLPHTGLSSPHLVPREGSPPHSSSPVWRPWF
uniref:Hairy-related 11 n=1 Tax=Scophthalmus maximus TaxID=52904 RepID=A0A8D3AL60_SCOMX